MLCMGTAYYNGTLYKHRLPPFNEWHSQIRGSKGRSPLRVSSPILFSPKEWGPGRVGPTGTGLEVARYFQKKRNWVIGTGP